MEQEFFRETAELYCARFHHLAEIGIGVLPFERAEVFRDANPFKQMFAQLAEVDELPCLYRWEITSPYNADAIKEAVAKLPKYTPRILKKAIAKDNTLYVGKVQSHIVGRVIQHLGYHLNQASHGLQLNDWAKSMNLTFKLHIIVLPHDVIPVEEIFETELAHKYEPLIGIH